jgi:mannose-1-phosphate guanylyltransferase/mannose-6-phosphate isomerase
MQLQPVILSGGSGTRLWPLSRQAHPKQFLSLLGDESLLQATARRVVGLGGGIEVLAPLVVCNEEHRFLVAEQLREIDQVPAGILLEPVGRNTAPALTLAALVARKDGADPVLIAMPADHVIGDADSFRDQLRRAVPLAETGDVVTFGIVPDVPETGFGYIHRGEALPDAGAYVLDRFVEKPDLATAERYLASGEYLWNAGIFVLKASRWLELIGQYQPAILAACRAAVGDGQKDLDFCRVDRDDFLACPADSIDYAVMEPLSADPGGRALVLPLDAKWSDIGAWSALWAVRERDAAGNACFGDVLAVEARNNLLHADGRMIAAVGVDDLIIVETADAVLVTTRERAQQVKEIAEQLKATGREEHRFHKRVHRPWGAYEGIDEGDRFQVKRLSVKPGASLSLQMHHHRAEHWVVVRGTARVTRGDEVFLLTENQSTYIPLGEKHRLENPGNVPLEIIEVQSGSYLGEDDIVRFDDAYRRHAKDD